MVSDPAMRHNGTFATFDRRRKAEFMALIFICRGALSACVILERCNAPRSVTWAVGCLLITLPVVFLFVR